MSGAGPATIKAVIRELTARLQRPLADRDEARRLAGAIKMAAASARKVLGDEAAHQVMGPLLSRGREIIVKAFGISAWDEPKMPRPALPRSEVNRLRQEMHERDVLLLRAREALGESVKALRARGAQGRELTLAELVIRAIRDQVGRKGTGIQ